MSIIVNQNPSGPHVDAFGRERVSNPYSLFELNAILGKQPLHVDETTASGGTSTYSTGNSYIAMAVTNTVGSQVVRQTKKYHPYQPGKSKLTYISGVLYTNSAKTNILARFGQFDPTMGHFVQMNNGIISLVERKTTGGVTTETVIPRNCWIDPLDGTGPSGLVINFTKAQILAIDIEWLGVGQVRIGFVVNGNFNLCYAFSHNEGSAITQPYMQMAKLPIRFEITGNGDDNEMRMICCTVMSEGGFVPLGNIFATNSITSYSVNSGTTFKPLFSISLRTVSPSNRATIKIKAIDIFNSDNNSYCSWRLVMNPTFGATSTFTDYDVANNSVARICYHANTETISGGTIIGTGFVSTRANETIYTGTDDLLAQWPIANNIAGTPDIFTIEINQIAGSGTPTVFIGVQWIENM